MRCKIPTSMLSESTKRKYSQSALNQMEKEEKEIRESVSNSEVEDFILKTIKGKKEKHLFKLFKDMLTKLNIYGAVDGFIIKNIIENVISLEKTKKMLEKVEEMGDVDNYVKLSKLCISYQKEITANLKNIGVTYDMRNKINSMTSNGDFTNDDINADDMEVIMKILEGDK